MNPPEKFIKIINQKRYNTATATLIAGDDFWDGHNWERHGRNTFLYKTPNGAFFVVHLTHWQGEADSLEAVDLETAIELYENSLTEERINYSEAFPNISVEDA